MKYKIRDCKRTISIKKRILSIRFFLCRILELIYNVSQKLQLKKGNDCYGSSHTKVYVRLFFEVMTQGNDQVEHV